jgi:hypothetical protein
MIENSGDFHEVFSLIILKHLFVSGSTFLKLVLITKFY